MNSCKRCNEQVDSNYCPNCGQPTTLKKINGQYVVNEIVNLFADKGMIYTIRKVLISPGKSVKQFLTEERYRFVKPITFVVITSLFYAIIKYFFQPIIDENTFVTPFLQIGSKGDDATEGILRWLSENYAYSNMLILLFMAFWIKLFFRKYGYNIFEIFILLCFVSGISTLLLSIGIIFQSFTNLKFAQISTVLSIYLVWAVAQFFDKKKVGCYAKVFLSYFLGGLIFAAIVLIIGFFI